MGMLLHLKYNEKIDFRLGNFVNQKMTPEIIKIFIYAIYIKPPKKV